MQRKKHVKMCTIFKHDEFQISSVACLFVERSKKEKCVRIKCFNATMSGKRPADSAPIHLKKSCKTPPKNANGDNVRSTPGSAQQRSVQFLMAATSAGSRMVHESREQNRQAAAANQLSPRSPFIGMPRNNCSLCNAVAHVDADDAQRETFHPQEFMEMSRPEGDEFGCDVHGKQDLCNHDICSLSFCVATWDLFFPRVLCNGDRENVRNAHNVIVEVLGQEHTADIGFSLRNFTDCAQQLHEGPEALPKNNDLRDTHPCVNAIKLREDVPREVKFLMPTTTSIRNPSFNAQKSLVKAPLKGIGEDNVEHVLHCSLGTDTNITSQDFVAMLKCIIAQTSGIKGSTFSQVLHAFRASLLVRFLKACAKKHDRRLALRDDTNLHGVAECFANFLMTWHANRTEGKQVARADQEDITEFKFSEDFESQDQAFANPPSRATVSQPGIDNLEDARKQIQEDGIKKCNNSKEEPEFSELTKLWIGDELQWLLELQEHFSGTESPQTISNDYTSKEQKRIRNPACNCIDFRPN